MRKLIYYTLLAMAIISCHKDSEDIDWTIPDCIDEILKVKPSTSILVQEINETMHYWINTGANVLDGDEYVLNNKCDTVCIKGGSIPYPCEKNYSDNWIILN